MTTGKRKKTTLSATTNNHISRLAQPSIHHPFTDIEEDFYDDYNTDDPSPVDEEPEYDTEEELYTLYRNTILSKMN